MTYRSGNGEGRREIYAGAVDKAIRDDSLALEFISAAENVEQAFARTRFEDEKQLNNAIALYRKLVKYSNTNGLKTLWMWLNGRPAVGGYNRAQALMAGSHIVAAEALGVKLGKDSMKFIEKQIIARNPQSEEESSRNKGDIS